MASLQVGQIIKPDIDIRSILELTSRQYGLEVVEYHEINSYDDRNYHIFVKTSTQNPYKKHTSADGYVLKILNSMDSRSPKNVETQHSFMQHLRNDGIPTPTPMPNMKGELMSRERIYKDNDNHSVGYGDYIVRLFAYIPGKRMVEVPYTPRLMFQAGLLLGRIHKSSQGFHHPSNDTFKSAWHMSELPRLGDFLYAVQDERDRNMIHGVIEEFKTKVVPKYDQLRKGMIHGDPNEQNILVHKTPDDAEHHVCGILDFNESTWSYLVFDVAMAIAYLMLDCSTMSTNDIGGHVLAGYVSACNIPELELLIMKTCIMGRLCQSLVYGEYTYTLHPENTYLLTTSVNGWKLFKALHCEDSAELLDNWKGIMNDYQN